MADAKHSVIIEIIIIWIMTFFDRRDELDAPMVSRDEHLTHTATRAVVDVEGYADQYPQ